jgi:hypothetical protein
MHPPVWLKGFFKIEQFMNHLLEKWTLGKKTSKSSIYECRQDVVDVRNIVPNTISSPMVESEQQKLIKPEPQVLNTLTATGDDDLDVPPLE